MKTYEIEVDVQTVFRVTLQAENKEEAEKEAIDQAYQDTWGNTATFGGATIFNTEEWEYEN